MSPGRVSCRRLAIGLIVSALLAVGCAKREAPREPAPLETVDVAPARDATASLAAEPVERRAERPGGFSGVLPEGFPSDVPLLRPSSLIDSSWRPDGALEIVLASSASPADAGASYAGMLAAAGWKGHGPGAAGRWKKGARTVEVELVDTRPGTRLRIVVLAP